MYYGNCDDGGEGSGWSWCDLGTDCFSCGLRAIPFAPPPPPPPPLSATPPPPPPAPAVGPEIVVDFDSSPNDCRWALACSDGYSYPNGIMPQRVRPSPPLVPGSTCTLTLKAYWGWGWYNGKWTYDALEFTNPYDPDQSGPRVETNYTFIVPEAPPSPAPPNLPPVAPIAYDSGFAVVLPQLIITYKFFNFSTACTASSNTTGSPPSPPSTPPPPPPPLPMATSSEISVEMIALGMGLYHERYCTSCLSECSAKAECLEFMYKDTTCWPQCNNAECQQNACTTEQAVSECLKNQIAQGIDYISKPGSSGTGSGPLVTGSFTLGEFRISVDKVKGAGVQIEFILTYSLTWNDTRLLTSPCRKVLDTMLSSVASTESEHAKRFWRPKLVLGTTETEPARERKLLESLYSQNGAVATLRIREAVMLAQDFQYRSFPFDRQTIPIHLRLPTVNLTGCDALVEQLRYKETLSFTDSNRILPQSATWLWDSCGTAGGGCRAADIENDIFLDLALLESRQDACPVVFKIKRNNDLFIIKQLIPSIVISEAPLLSLYMDATVPPLVGARASLHIIALLLVVTRANTDLGLGTLSSLIWTDEFALVQFFVILAGLVETIVVHALIRFGCKVLAVSVDGVFRVLLPFVLFPCLVVGFILKGVEQEALSLLVIVGGMLLFLSYSVARVLYKDWQIQRNRKMMVKKLKALKMEINGSKLTDKEVDQIMRKTFDTFDLDKSKKLEKAEVRLILDAMYPNLGRQQVATAMKAVKSDEIVYEDFAIIVEEWQKISFERHEEEPHKRRTILGQLGWGVGSKSKKACHLEGAKLASLAKTSKPAGSSAPKLDVAAAFAAGLDKADSLNA
eukprot:jgi/Chrpa1/4609/Chrysochromulina_OHIO_Genome00018962-RA